MPKLVDSPIFDQLSINSSPYVDPLGRINWKGLDRSAFWLPENAVSLCGLEKYTVLPAGQRRDLSRYEFMYMFEAALRFQGILMERIGRSVVEATDKFSLLNYRLHMLREQAGHSMMFLELVRRLGMKEFFGYKHKPLTRFIARYVPLESALFWSMVMIGEEVLQRFYRYLRKNQQSVCPVVSELTNIHVLDEARHLTHVQRVLEIYLKDNTKIRHYILNPLVRRTFKEFVTSFYFPDAKVYEAAGLYPGDFWVKSARKNSHRVQFINDNLHTALRPLRKYGFHLDW